MLRTHRQIAGLSGDFELLDPGLTWAPSRHPEEAGSRLHPGPSGDPSQSVVAVGADRKPA